MKRKFLYTAGAIGIAAILLYACRHEIPGVSVNTGGTGTPPPVTTCSPDSVYFTNTVMPLIASNCAMSGCHDNGTHADGVNLTTYAGILRQVSPGNGANSKLYKVLNKSGSDRMPPPPMAGFTTAQKNIILQWINQGAKNNSCTGSCDTTVFTYNAAIKPIMDNKCAGCHNPGNLGGNIDLSVYTAVRTQALNGKLYGSVAHLAGYAPMPKNTAKLSDCEIRQIQRWIAAGSLNN